MQVDRKALYNALRMHWLQNRALAVKNWQVEDYRQVSLEALFANLGEMGFIIDRHSFISYAENYETPEELSDVFNEYSPDAITRDHIYLIVFELWRRLLPERRTLSIFCDELDYQIHLYDLGKLENQEPLQDALTYLQQILEENSDSGNKPKQVWDSIKASCANDIESFLYDYISEKVDLEDIAYAEDLLDGFSRFLETPWFDFLRARLLMTKDPEKANESLRKIIKKSSQEDIEFNLEVLSYLDQEGEKELFLLLAKQTVPLLKSEEDFQDLLNLCASYFQYLDNESKEKAVLDILSTRIHRNLEENISSTDAAISSLKQILRK